MLKTFLTADTTAGKNGRIGVALAGGGPLGISYEIGALHAIEEALEGVELTRLHAYVGVSAGAVVSACLANRLSTAELCRVFVRGDATDLAFDPGQFWRPAMREYGARAARVPGLVWDVLRDFIRRPMDTRLRELVAGLTAALPSGLFDNDSIERYLREVFSADGRSNDFGGLDARLFVVAVRLESGEAVEFGGAGFEHVPISRAVQASTALPGLFPPVSIDGEHYVDGALQRTLHASAALKAGVDLLFCVNPIVPHNAQGVEVPDQSGTGSVAEGGLATVLAQTFRAIIHSRMQIGMERYRERFADRDVLLLEPDCSDTGLFRANWFSFKDREQICENAYQLTRSDLLSASQELEPMLARHGIRLRTDLLAERDRHFDTALHPEAFASQPDARADSVADRLKDTLDDLESWIDEQR
jgi:predicted acylesterase/phospholipase RssA